MTKADRLAADRLLNAACRTAVAAFRGGNPDTARVVLHDAGRGAELRLGGAE